MYQRDFKRDIHQCSTPLFFGTHDAKPNLQYGIPMIIGVGRRRVWNSNVVGFSFIPFGHKSEIRSFEAGDKSPVWVERWGGGMCVGGRLEKSGQGAFSKKTKILRVGEGKCREE
ncbi:hypothetical protein AVEN_29854-1 [Araneus ventricosus]|uniref:Uncharacterized protein n=1 Tax=Araneus ventricosus TaxID=182803 RepID=A0A4Y2JPJ6_ARAVE|nr:hypothetical protein AVEN_29854-1 [Araneus ventricosus]